MDTDILGALRNFEESGDCFEHRNKKLTRAEAFQILNYAKSKGYKFTSQLKDTEVDKVLEMHRNYTQKSIAIKKQEG